MSRNYILLRRLPEREDLPNSCVFFSKYQRLRRHVLTPTRAKITRIYVRKIGLRQQRIRRTGNKQRRRQQAGAGLDLSTTIDLGKKAAGSKLSKMMINDAIGYITTTYKKIKNKITNYKVKAVMDTGVDNYLVNRAVKLID